ncbi:hypothetical protein ABMA27_011735 [Loxostege sticticalis]|uniref:glycerophosphodiester phosphodiesterase n=1 Tax=Loxostege sticticalis TaxID=481309 RepID=A0ABR3IH81_LOXSC
MNNAKLWIVCVSVCVLCASSSASSQLMSADACSPLVIAHRGASGYVPEHTLGAYALAVTMGADYLEPDLVMTKDGHLIARHDNELGLTTDVASRPEFASRYRTKTVDGTTVSGWFTEDFTLAEIKMLRAIERIPRVRPGNARMDGAFEVPTFQEIIDLAKRMQTIHCREIGIYPELKHGTYFQQLGLAMERPVVEAFHSNGYRGPEAPVYIQSFEINNLKELKTLTDLRLLQLFGARQPYDQVVQGTNVTYLSMATPEGLKEIATYAYAVGPEKTYIIQRTVNDTLGSPTPFVAMAHAAGLKVHPYTFRSENAYLPAEFRSNDPSPDAIGDSAGEIRAFLSAGIDGLFVDQPDILVQLREPCVNEVSQCTSASTSVVPMLWMTLFLSLFLGLWK